MHSNRSCRFMQYNITSVLVCSWNSEPGESEYRCQQWSSPTLWGRSEIEFVSAHFLKGTARPTQNTNCTFSASSCHVYRTSSGAHTNVPQFQPLQVPGTSVKPKHDKNPKYHKSWSQFSVAHCLTFWSRCVIYLERVWLTQRTVQKEGITHWRQSWRRDPRKKYWLSMSEYVKRDEASFWNWWMQGRWERSLKEALIIPHWESCRQNHRKKMCWKNMENMEKKHHVLIIYIPEVSAGRQIQIAQLYGFHSTVPTTMKLMEMFRLKRPGSSSICSARSPTPAQNITKSPEDWNLANSQIAIWAWSSDKRVDQQCDCDVFLTTSCRIQKCILYTFVSFWLSEFCCQKKEFSVFGFL